MKVPLLDKGPAHLNRILTSRALRLTLRCSALIGLLMWAQSRAGAQPANDAFANAQNISGASGQVSGSNVGATKQAGEPNHGGNAGGASVWYVWEAPASGTAEFQLLNSDFDTTMGAYTGGAVNALTPLAGDNEAFDYFPIVSLWLFFSAESRIRFPVQAGVSYYIAVDGNAGVSGNVELNWNLVPRPANDDFANAQVITGTDGFVAAHNVGATKEPGEPNHAGIVGGQSIWYRWTAPVSGSARFYTANSVNSFGTGATGVISPLDTMLAVYTGSGVSSLTQVAANDNNGASVRSLVTFTATAGTTYAIAVDTKSFSTNHGSVVLFWSDATPVNNDFANAQVLSGPCGLAQGHTTFGNKETGEPNPTGNAGGASAWFSWTAPMDGPAVFTTLGSPFFDTLLGVYTGSAVNSLSLVADNDDITGGFLPGLIYSRVEFGATAGTTYNIVVDGWNNGAGTFANGPFFLSWASGAPLNDEFFSAQAVAGLSGTVTGCNFFASKDFGEPDHAGNIGGKSVWYEWTAPASGVATISLRGTFFDSLLAVYTGASVDALMPIAENNDVFDGYNTGFYSAAAFPVDQGITYKIAVDGGNDGAGFISDGLFMMQYNIAVMQTNQPPMLVCPTSSTVPCQTTNGTSLTLMATATDAEGDVLNVSWAVNGLTVFAETHPQRPPGTPVALTLTHLFAPGTNQFTLSVTDAGGLSNSCQGVIATIVDTEPPLVTCPDGMVTPATAGSCSTLVNPGQATATDNCIGVTVSATRSDGRALLDPFSVGLTIITWQATDLAGNRASCAQAIRVLDQEAPQLVQCPSDLVATNEPGRCGARLNPGSPSATDNCGTVSVASSRSDGHPLADEFPLGVTTITWELRDPSSNKVSCVQKVEVLDAQPPSLSACPPGLTLPTGVGVCAATVKLSAPHATDTCSAAQVTGRRSDKRPLSDPFPIGATIVTWVATDAAGNSASCTQKVTVEDRVPPRFVQCPDEVRVPADPGQCASTQALATPQANDNCSGVTVSGRRSDGKPLSDPFPIGATIVTWVATDAAGNPATCTQRVTVEDRVPPRFVQCPDEVRLPTDPGQCASTQALAPPQANDNCSGVTVSGRRSDGKPLSDPYPTGVTMIVWEATDATGNAAQCMQRILVADSTPPTLRVQAVANASTRQPLGSGPHPNGFYQLLAQDGCDAAPLIYVADSASGFIAGPFEAGTVIKLTQSPGGTPTSQPMAGGSAIHLRINGSARIYATDNSGNRSAEITLSP